MRVKYVKGFILIYAHGPPLLDNKSTATYIYKCKGVKNYIYSFVAWPDGYRPP